MRTRAGFLASLLVAAAFVACGSRGPLDFEVIYDTPDTSTVDVAVDGATSTDARTDARADGQTGDARPDAPPIINCGACLIQSCGQQIFGCIQSAGCREVFQCVTQQCIGGGSPDPNCIFRCAQEDPQGGVEVLRIFQCVTQKCGEDCAGLLGGFGGGGGGGGGGTRDAGSRG
jgi:predicted small lipoprotein YifL